jgi:hypothetical protein
VDCECERGGGLKLLMVILLEKFPNIDFYSNESVGSCSLFWFCLIGSVEAIDSQIYRGQS